MEDIVFRGGVPIVDPVKDTFQDPLVGRGDRVPSNREDVEMPVAPWVDFLGGFITRKRNLWVTLGRMETYFLSEEIKDVSITSPIYICGLARGGSTILLEALASHKETVSHRYKDFPLLYTPYWWNRYLDMVPRREEVPVERAHKDRLQITSESPEAMEEMLWMAFFPHCHDPRVSHIINEFCENPDFESFYYDHIRKMLLLRGGQRYLAKGNYNTTRIEYIFKLFPDARFVIPVREPCAHVASLIRQHDLFCRAEIQNPRALAHMSQLGHFEFGLNRRPVNTGDSICIRETLRSWDEGRDAEGYAKQWSAVYGFLADVLERNTALRKATLIVPYEDLVNNSEITLKNLFRHVHLFDADDSVRKYASLISPPNYYRPNLTVEAKKLILAETAAVATRFGFRCKS